MLELSAKLEYSLLALIELCKHYETRKTIGTKEIAHSQNIPDRYLDQILAELKRSGIVDSFRGAKGGHRLNRSSKEITLAEIIRGLEPEKRRTPRTESSASRKAVLSLWQKVKEEVESSLTNVTLEDFYRHSQSLEQSPPMYYI